MTIIRAADIGFGQVKYTQSADIETNTLRCDAFPSLAPAARKEAIGSEFSKRTNVVEVEVDGVPYLVGPDVRSHTSRNHSSVLDMGFSHTAVYRALLKGALYYMREPVIDLLVLGLPVSNFREREHVRKLAVGTHALPGKRSVDVKEVYVVPQPVGGLYSVAVAKGIVAEVSSQTSLIVDPGYLTLDWVVAEGTNVVASRSGSHEGSMAAYLKCIADQVSRDQRCHFTDLAAIELALRSRHPLGIYERAVSLDKYVAVGEARLREAVNSMAASVGDGVDIRRIILVGGPARYFYKAVSERFPDHKVLVSPDPLYANVRGFFLLGAARFKKSLTEASA